MKKISILLSTLLLMALGFSSCNDDLAQPPVIVPEGGFGTGTWTDPYSVTQLLEGISGSKVWAKGYIVGYIQSNTTGGASSLTAESAKFTAEGAQPSNIMIADSPDEKDFSKCTAVNLPQGEIRSALNLKDNPGNIGKEVCIKGNITKYFGVNGMKELTAYNWGDKGIDEGGDNPDKPGTGNGSADTPFKVSQVLGGASGTDVWVTGYIVGWIQSNTTGGASSLTAESAKFTAEDAQPSNMMLAETPDEKDYSKCTAVNLPSGAVRAALNLKDNPGNLGKEVTVQGNLSKYFGVNGVRDLKAYNWGPKGTTGDDKPQTGSEIYSGLVNDANDWKFENVEKPENVSEIWSWMTYNNSGYLNATAFIDNTPYATEAWAISPEISLSGYKTASVAFDHTSKYQTTLRQLCGFAVRESGSKEWKMLTIPTWPEAGSWTFVNSGAIDLSAYAGKKIELAFKYGSSAQGADKWEIKNFKVTGTK